MTSKSPLNGRIIKDKPKKHLQEEYARHVCGIGLRLACFSLFALPSAEHIVVSGYSQRLHKGTGHITDEYLFSTRFSREGLRKLNFNSLQTIDPIASHELFETKSKISSTYLFKAIMPFVPEN